MLAGGILALCCCAYIAMTMTGIWALLKSGEPTSEIAQASIVWRLIWTVLYALGAGAAVWGHKRAAIAFVVACGLDIVGGVLYLSFFASTEIRFVADVLRIFFFMAELLVVTIFFANWREFHVREGIGRWD
ncbi:MAG: hypothetical protein KC609_00425 [Myxococcales bacterium]|nr:hypothetical protein [Myxococcales bacterium]